MRLRWIVLAVALAGCVRPVYQRPEYANLPRINLLMIEHGGIALSRSVNEVRYQLVYVLAEESVALTGGPYDDSAPEVSIDIAEQGSLPGAAHLFDVPQAQSTSIEPYRGTFAQAPFDPTEVTMAVPAGGNLNIVAVSVYFRQPHERDPALVGQMRAVLGTDLATAAKLADLLAPIIRKGMESRSSRSE